MIQYFLDVFDKNATDIAIIYKGRPTLYRDLVAQIVVKAQRFLIDKGVQQGDVVALIGDFTPAVIAMMFALIHNNNIVVPLSKTSVGNINKVAIAGSHKIITEVGDGYEMLMLDESLIDPHYYIFNHLRAIEHPGLVLFTSGTTGEPKAAVHDFNKLLEKFRTPRPTLRTLNFLLFDHIGGLNTMFHTLSNGGVVLTIDKRNPETVCEFIETYKIESLPVSPTFLNLLVISEAYKHYDLSSLKNISYGSEPMLKSTLSRLKTIIPNVKFQQTYGMVEIGVLRSKSKSDSSLWVKVGGEGFETRVVDGLLEIKAVSAMLGYLNAPSPFTEDGWLMTGDMVEQDGEYIKILGRQSDIINVGGLKVYPVEVESVIQTMDNVAEVTVYGEKNAIVGNIVCAKVCLLVSEDYQAFMMRMKQFCQHFLQPYQIPIKATISYDIQYTERFKKKRV
jgi:long-chain acyl-CoA synthetase